MAKLKTYDIKWREDISTEWQDSSYIAMAIEMCEGSIKGESLENAIANFREHEPNAEIIFIELQEAQEPGNE